MKLVDWVKIEKKAALYDVLCGRLKVIFWMNTPKRYLGYNFRRLGRLTRSWIERIKNKNKRD